MSALWLIPGVPAWVVMLWYFARPHRDMVAFKPRGPK